MLNLQAATSRDESFTFANVRPIAGGSASDLPREGEAACASRESCGYALVRYEDGAPFDPADRNPNYGNPTSYQSPRAFRIGIRLTF